MSRKAWFADSALAIAFCIGIFNTPHSAMAQSFEDVPSDYWAFEFIESLYASGITAGCGNNNYCPGQAVTRAQMSVFLERGMKGSDYEPLPATGLIFADVAAGDFAANFIEQLYADGITSGCGNSNYCPNAIITRAQMAVFLLRAKYGPGYVPPAPSGVFADVSVSHWAAGWIERLAAEGITSGCGSRNYCPSDAVKRDQMAVFLVRTFDLPINGNGGGGNPTIPDLHFAWRIPLAGPYSGVRPVVAPNGTIYAVDVLNNLFAVSPDGKVQWSAGQAGSKGVDIGSDGTIYTGNEDSIKAFTPDGNLLWTYTQSPRALVTQDIAVGPDGNIYAIAASGMGVFSLTPDGELRWTNTEVYARPFISFAELAFGPTVDGTDYQLYFYANAHTRAIRLSDGESLFSMGGNQDPRVSPLDGTWHTGDSAYSPDGTLLWTFQYSPFNGAREPSMGTSGTHYAVNLSRTVFAIDPAGVAKWNQELNETVGFPDVDPTESQLLLSAGGSSLPVALKSISTRNGSELWRMQFPGDTSGLEQYIDTQIAYNDDGSRAYVVTALSGGNISYLNAINTDPSIPSASTLLRVVDITLDGRSQGRSVSMSGVVTVVDENLAPVSGATVDATWTLPDGSTVAVSASTNASGEAKFSTSGDGGLYLLDVSDVSLAGYTFDPIHSVLSAGKAWF